MKINSLNLLLKCILILSETHLHTCVHTLQSISFSVKQTMLKRYLEIFMMTENEEVIPGKILLQ